MTKAVLSSGQLVSLNMFNTIDKTPLADDVELYILEKDGSLTPYKITKFDKYNYSFNLPNEKNNYLFLVKAIFKTHIGGIAYYPLDFTVS